MFFLVLLVIVSNLLLKFLTNGLNHSIIPIIFLHCLIVFGSVIGVSGNTLDVSACIPSLLIITPK